MPQHINVWLIATILTGSALFFRNEACAQQSSTHQKTSSDYAKYLLDNYKFSLEGGRLSDLANYSAQKGLSFGYYLLKYDTFQKGIFLGNERHKQKVLVNSGKTLLSINGGLHYEERWLEKDFFDAYPGIKEQLAVIPITFQWISPNHFSGGRYSGAFLGYNLKKLIGSYEYDKNDSVKKTSKPATLKDGSTFSHSISGGIMAMTTFGLYGCFGIDYALNARNRASSYHRFTQKQRFGSPINREDFWKGKDSTNLHFRVGLDITMLLRKFYGMSFREGPLVIE